MDNLNKENFWNELYSRYPKGTQHFCNWIDGYKKIVSWNELFNAGINKDVQWDQHEREYICSGETVSPKFHDLPWEFQYGILSKYVSDTSEKYHYHLSSFTYNIENAKACLYCLASYLETDLS